MSSALKGKSIQMATLVKLTKALSPRPQVPELVAISPFERILEHVRRAETGRGGRP